MKRRRYFRTFFQAIASGVLFGAAAFAQEPEAANFGGDFSFSPSVLSSRTYYEGAETLGRVGHEAILKRDILHQLKKYAYIEYVKQREAAAPEEKERYTDEYFERFITEFVGSERIYSQVLDDYIRKLLFYNDYVLSRSKEEVDEQKKNLGRTYDNDYLPTLYKQCSCKNTQELKEIFEDRLGTTLEQDKRLFIQDTLGSSWLEYNLGADQYDPSVVELRRYYEANRSLYEQPEQVRWRKMSVLFSNHANREEAMDKIVYMGNAVKAAQSASEQETLFDRVARADSEDFLAAQGGYCGWSKRGEIPSATVEEALFNESLPVGAMSKILEDGSGLTIVVVIERQFDRYLSFLEVQEKVREKIRDDRREAIRQQYEEKLAQRFAIEIYTVTPEERRERIESARQAGQSASGRENIF